MEYTMNNGFAELTPMEMTDTDGGSIILAGCVIVGGCIATFGGGVAVGYGLAKWLG